MFSFIKWFGGLMENAKKKKGLWFTLLTTFSLLGIFVSLYFVNFMVSDVAQKTYENQKNSYVLAFKNTLQSQNLYTEAVAITLSKNKDIANDFFSSDENASQNQTAKIQAVADSLNRSLGKKSIKISFEKVAKNIQQNGLETTAKGTVFKDSMPMVDKNGTLYAVVVEKNIDDLVQVYKKEHKKFAYFVNESAMHKLHNEVKKRFYKSYHDKYYIKYDAYDKSFIDALKDVPFDDKLQENGFVKDNHYFSVYQKVYDSEGDFVGVAVVGEEVSSGNSFVNLVKNLVNSVTMVALGLIVSMLLFLF